mmetsp:Transcript_21186/g.63757  ORF Transcript_21186/g.63757 Transcript_21186/m.63757 type:complete len:120 (-) Transcript_21186:1097-1456(-)|eukprot:CAMPEP_0206138070 /NCGR_PEP_ID=MMETSP1473-20131121/3049_1 /ASSEMBLY_ACC=CAM_ASM_001109 /TAXON_ID=1461547 /ORGANISM="Stichococcus sp, Strain RCC1054" /LENGTH=119 /DNA_ID=CAMNT_0053531387 /DNA_START=62 /DNA_END=421 /DNA_ORIENTATION=-
MLGAMHALPAAKVVHIVKAMPLLTIDGSPWVTAAQASGVVMATLGCTVVGMALALRGMDERGLLGEDEIQGAPTGRRRFTPEEYDASQQSEQAEWKESPEPLYEQTPKETSSSSGTPKN